MTTTRLVIFVVSRLEHKNIISNHTILWYIYWGMTTIFFVFCTSYHIFCYIRALYGYT